MGLNKVLLLSQLTGYTIALIISLCIVIPMSLHQHQFGDHCFLLSTGSWQKTDGQLSIDWALQKYCYYIILVGVLLFFISATQIFRTARFLIKGAEGSSFSTFLDFIIGIWLTTTTIIPGIMITLGFKSWCNVMVEKFPSCEAAADQKIHDKDGILIDGFYVQLGTAQFGIWGSFFIWVGLSVFTLLKLCRHHEMEYMGVSFYKEGQSLISENSCESPSNSLGRECNCSTSEQTV